MKDALTKLNQNVQPLLQETWALSIAQDRKMSILNSLTAASRSFDEALNQLRLAEADADQVAKAAEEKAAKLKIEVAAVEPKAKEVQA